MSLRELVAELVQLKPDVIFTGSSPAIFALKQATETTPILIVSSTDPVRSGMVAVSQILVAILPA